MVQAYSAETLGCRRVSLARPKHTPVLAVLVRDLVHEGRHQRMAVVAKDVVRLILQPSTDNSNSRDACTPVLEACHLLACTPTSKLCCALQQLSEDMQTCLA